jgi:hypothetical protein
MSHCSHRVGGRRVKGEDIENATAVEQQPRLIDDEDLGWIQGATSQSSRMNATQRRRHLDDVRPYEALWQEAIWGQHRLLAQHLALVLIERACRSIPRSRSCSTTTAEIVTQTSIST